MPAPDDVQSEGVSKVDDAADVRRAKDGDMAAAERLLTEHLSGMLRMLTRLLPSREDAEDVAQEACLHALMGLDGLRRPDLFGPWLRTIAYNRAMQWQRRRYAEAAVWPRLWTPDATDGPDTGAAQAADTQAALGRLSPADRDAVVLRYVEGWNASEIARLQGSVPGTVRWRLHKALEHLREALSDPTSERSDDNHG